MTRPKQNENTSGAPQVSKKPSTKHRSVYPQGPAKPRIPVETGIDIEEGRQPAEPTLLQSQETPRKRWWVYSLIFVVLVIIDIPDELLMAPIAAEV